MEGGVHSDTVASSPQGMQDTRQVGGVPGTAWESTTAVGQPVQLNFKPGAMERENLLDMVLQDLEGEFSQGWDFSVFNQIFFFFKPQGSVSHTNRTSPNLGLFLGGIHRFSSED